MRYKILVVDDEFELRCLLTEILEQAGFEVVLAGNCRQAEKMCYFGRYAAGRRRFFAVWKTA